MTFMEFGKKFPTEEAAINYFVDIRYKGVYVCPHCEAVRGVYRHKRRIRYCACSNCNNSFSVFKGTIFEDTKLDIRKWFYAMNIFLNAKKGVSACNLQREIGGSYRTAWRMLHQIRAAMGDKDTFKVLKDLVEVDETYVGGKPRKYTSKRGRGTSKIPVIGVFERERKQMCAKAVYIPGEKGKDLLKLFLIPFIKKIVAEGSTVVTDDFVAYSILDDEDENYIHRSIKHSDGQYSDGNGTHTNNVECFWSILKRSIIGIYHKVSPKYLQRYVNEACFRLNNRTNLSPFDRLLKKSVMPEANRAWQIAEGGGWL